jgi:ATP-dependent Clp protease ATP-binding subunit ClpB
LLKNSRAVIKIDCAEFQHSHEIAKLIGSPPGYLGHRETHALLSQEALNQHHTDTTKLSFVPFDEIEKASDALWNLLLGILDKATLTLGDNRRVDFSAAIVFLTSNLGAAEMSSLVSPRLGFHVPSFDDPVATAN